MPVWLPTWIYNFAQWMDKTPFGRYMRESLYSFPIVETLHIFGLVFLLFVDREVAVELDDRSRSSQSDILVGFDISRNRIVNSGIHLRCNEAPPNEEIEFVFING